ncbi:SNF2-related protein [Raoultella ornithinolytica]|uniref:SNF2-related protein n=1 Tax=Raoultella ornithinolytica TaxID=54291 RepID=UPI00292BFB9B|nr:SNF2-related protein [Raoultella ornithinolytica]MDV1094927.1 SNF2-related protein [Raoultella ornithinolytica]MDV1122729.1 SNF2-related protein [Raoultella ornithinolytica]MDV1893244.1 SNF2-related protein [Raoultella ornithinolytica]
MDQLLETINAATSVNRLIEIVSRLHKPRAVAAFGVKKIEGVSIQKTRRAANSAAVALLNSLPPGFDGAQLTDEQRQVLAGYTGEGGLTDGEGSQYEYYTPQFMADGIWDLFADYGISSGHILEPSAGAGIFQETKRQGVIMTSAELSPISGRINQLLHPEDAVNVGPFESLAAKDEMYDHAVGNVPFGEGRSGVAGLDPAYANEKNVGNYFVLRTIDKVKPGGLVVLVVPNGMTDGTKYRKLRDKVSRKAEFLGAHRMPSGTFSESGTDTVVDVWVLRKHPELFAEMIPDTTDKTLKTANVLWDTFLKGKWFTTAEGKKFVYGDMERTSFRNTLVVKQDGRISNAGMKTALSRRFESRIDWDALGVTTQAWQGAKEGDKRLVGGVWHEFDGISWQKDATTGKSVLDAGRYGAATFDDLRTVFQSPQGILSLSWDQISAVHNDHPSVISDDVAAMVRFAGKQRENDRERIMRGALIGQRINRAMDLRSMGMSADDELADAARMTAQEVAKYGPPHAVKLADITEAGAKNWMTFAGNVQKDGNASDLLAGRLEVSEGAAGIDFTRPEQVIAHLFSGVALMPITLEHFREVFTGELPGDDEAALDYLAKFPDIAIDGSGCLLPMGRATSGEISSKVAALVGWRDGVTGEQKANFERQLALIEEKRNFTPLNKVTIKLNSRWLDRRLIKEFLADQGYDEFKYTTPDLEIEGGILVSPDDYAGKDGVFTGYQLRTVNGKHGNEFKKANNKDGFLNQLENYLNGVKPRGQNANQYLDKISQLETSLNDWLRTHPQADQIARDYNDAFNGYIPFTHSDAPLGLEGISGERLPMSYQNEEVRRLSEDGRGIMGFGTGLGKTMTALALEAFNFETGRTKRTCIVVPKAVYQNWYHEAHGFYSAETFANMMFVGLDEVYGESGNILTAPVLDEEGAPRLDKSGNPLMRNVVKEASTATIVQRLNVIPSSNWRTVIMTKEQFASIPLRDETIEENSQQAIFNAAEMGRLDLASGKHRDAQKKNKIKDRAADTGTTKKQNIPYFEDMNFDSVLADEGHNYRNSFGAGRESGQLAYLPSPAVSKMARDMAVKAAYMMKRNNGRGVVMMTATPLVNSPIDAFNMLSTVIPQEEWLKMGIITPDDFVRVFGKTETVQVQKISGEVEERQGLVGFQNLDGLRGIFHRWTTLKNVADVGATVKIPDIEENTLQIPMTGEQEAAYEDLRKRAQELTSNTETVEVMGKDGQMTTMIRIKGPGEKPDDFIFSIIRDMDKVAIDPDLYASAITFQFPVEAAEAVKGIMAGLPAMAGGKVADDAEEAEEDETGGLVSTRASKVVSTTVTAYPNHVELRASITLEADILKAIAAAGIDMQQVSHPVPPKYAALIENLREGLNRGKQIVFIDEKAQHNKLRRIIASALQMPETEIGIINASTVAGAGGVKLKKVKQPTEPTPNKDGEYKAGAWEAYYEKLAKYEDYVSAKNDAGLEGMEGIAADYNEGRTRIIICNKKAEVGINLHIGTTDIHHLTLPWTPASIDQRNGRGARVGSPQEKVNVHYYCGKGTFDDFRLDTLKRKKDWIKMVMTSDLSEVTNGDADDADERAIMLAANPEERRSIMERQNREREERLKEKAQREANNALDTYLKAANAAGRDIGELEANLKLAQESVERNQKHMDYLLENQVGRNGQRSTIERLNTSKKRVRELRFAISRSKDADTAMKRSKGDVERAIKTGVLDINIDVVQNPQEYVRSTSNILLHKGSYYRATAQDSLGALSIVCITGIDAEAETVTCRMAWNEDFSYGSRSSGSTLELPFEAIKEAVTFEEGLAESRELAAAGVASHQLSTLLNRDQFYDAIRIGVMKVAGPELGGWRGRMDIDYWPRRNENGQLELVFISSGDFAYANRNRRKEDNSIAPEEWVYPDTSDEALKREVAKLQSGPDAMNQQSAEGFLRALFGVNYEKEMEAYGVQASMDDVTRIFDDWMEGRDLSGRSLMQITTHDIRSVFRKPTGEGIETFWKGFVNVRGFRALMKGYSNTSEIDQMFDQVRAARIAHKIEQAKAALVVWRDALYAQYSGLSDADGWAALESTAFQEINGAQRTVSDADSPLETPATLWIKVGTLIHAFEAKYVTKEDFADAVAVNRLVGMAISRAKRLKGGDYVNDLPDMLKDATWPDYVSLKNGGITEEEIQARGEAEAATREQQAQVADEAAEEAAEADFTITVNENPIRGRARVRGRWWSVSEDAGAVYLIADNLGSNTIRKAKDAIKSIGGKFWNFEVNPVADIELDRPAWMVSTRYSIDEVRKIIAEAA